jgi:IS5 family transposase
LTGPSPVDRGKPGSKIHAIGDRNGLPLHADISAANINDHKILEDVLDGVAPVRQPVGRPRKRPANPHGDKGYDYRACRQALARRRIKARIARKGIESSTRRPVPLRHRTMPGVGHPVPAPGPTLRT